MLVTELGNTKIIKILQQLYMTVLDSTKFSGYCKQSSVDTVNKVQ